MERNFNNKKTVAFCISFGPKQDLIWHYCLKKNNLELRQLRKLALVKQRRTPLHTYQMQRCKQPRLVQQQFGHLTVKKKKKVIFVFVCKLYNTFTHDYFYLERSRTWIQQLRNMRPRLQHNLHIFHFNNNLCISRIWNFLRKTLMSEFAMWKCAVTFINSIEFDLRTKYT